MCGIAGFGGAGDRSTLEAMTHIQKHRGPDASGFYHVAGQVGLGARRLSIIDLVTGDQPVANENKNIWVVYNGEIYNFRDLRRELEARGHGFRTRGDTEVIVHAYEEYGLKCVDHFNGMFAFALWDGARRRLILARDRLGEKPLYYAIQGSTLFFASEIKGLLAAGVRPDVNFRSLNAYLSLRYVPGNETMFAGIYKLPPGCFLIWSDGSYEVQRYWELDFSRDLPGTDATISDEFFALLDESTRSRLVSDVPLGAFLSGGLDSSAVVALMARAGHSPLHTFSIGFRTDIDETDSARRMAARLGTIHTETYVEPTDFHLLPEIIWHLDDPLGDAIIIPIYVLARSAVKQVKVALTGEGADEILAGYVHHLAMYYGYEWVRRVPKHLRQVLLAAIEAVPMMALNGIFPYPAQLGHSGRTKFAAYLSAIDDPGAAYFRLVELFSAADKQRLFAPSFYDAYLKQTDTARTYAAVLNDGEHDQRFLSRLLALDHLYWLPDSQLFKLDRIAMANSLETRVPYLDHRLVELCASLAPRHKIKRFQVKCLLREAVASHRLLPAETAWAKKKAFYFPTEKCFGPNFDEYLMEHLAYGYLRRSGMLNWPAVERWLASPTRELLDNKQRIALLILELWFTIFARQIRIASQDLPLDPNCTCAVGLG